ncbi:MAG: metallophosphoesterase [Victivallales bacterium]|nr:metallophosphoesterase [Victivallales bacterium]
MMFYAFTAAVLGINIYSWWKLRNAFIRNSTLLAIMLLLIIIALLFTPVWSRLLFRGRHVPDFITQASWTWLAWVFWLTTALLVCDIYELAIYAVNAVKLLWHPDSAPVLLRFCPSPKAAAFIAIGFTAFMSVWGVIESYHIRVNSVDLFTDAIPEGAAPYRIAFISDLHIGPALSDRKLKKIIALLKDNQADILLSTGDLIDGRSERELTRSIRLTEIAPKDGKFAVFGNHDVYSSLDYSRKCHASAGFTLLEDAAANPQPWLYIFGEKDPAEGWHPGKLKTENAGDTAQIPQDTFSILLKHRPDVSPDSKFNLQLSGHSHGGQLFPFTLLVRLQYKYKESALHDIGGGRYLYVSMGTGLWGPPFRVLATPEITIFNIRRKSI